MKCIQCGKELAENSKFCTGCGQRIPRCPTCGKPLMKPMRFCTADGTPIPEEILALFPAEKPAAEAVFVPTAIFEEAPIPAQEPAPTDWWMTAPEVAAAASEPEVKPAKQKQKPAKKEKPARKKRGSAATVVLAIILSLMILTLLALGAYILFSSGLLGAGQGQSQMLPAEDDGAASIPEPTEKAAADTTVTEPAVTARDGYGVVTKSGVVVRENADDTAAAVRTTVYGERITITGIGDGWAKITDGWIPLDSIYIDGDKGTGYLACGTVIGDRLNVRSGPGMDYDVIGVVTIGNEITILEKISIDGVQWGCIENGWVSMDFVYAGETMDLAGGMATITGDVVNVRCGPGVGYEVAVKVKEGDQVEILAFLPVDGTIWGCIESGWLSMDYARMN